MGNIKRKIAVRINDYIRYVNENGNNKLDPNTEIYGIGSFPPKFIRDTIINEEIFNGTICNYSTIINNSDYILIEFSSKLGNKYRIDLYKELNTNIWHIGFSEFHNSTSDPIKYEEETDNKESVDIFSRIIWILKDLNMGVEYCIGSTGNDKKNNIYEYMMRFVSNWEKRETEEYPLGWGIFFKI